MTGCGEKRWGKNDLFYCGLVTSANHKVVVESDGLLHRMSSHEAVPDSKTSEKKGLRISLLNMKAFSGCFIVTPWNSIRSTQTRKHPKKQHLPPSTFPLSNHPLLHPKFLPPTNQPTPSQATSAEWHAASSSSGAANSRCPRSVSHRNRRSNSRRAGEPPRCCFDRWGKL